MRKELPWAMAFADTLAIPCYIYRIDPMYGQIVGLALKILLAPLLLRGDSIIVRQTGPLLFVIATVMVSLVFATFPAGPAMLAALGFIAHLSITLLLRPQEIPQYFKAMCYFVTAYGAIFILMAMLGHIDQIWGRFNYFGNTHPNLGSEIAAAGVFCGVISVRLKPFLLCAAILYLNSALMEGRAAMLAIAMSVGLRLLHEVFVGWDANKVQLRILLAMPVAVAIAVFGVPLLLESLKLTDRHRGVGTGFVGREDQWLIAWDGFIQRPITGQGLGWFVHMQEIGSVEMGAHNFFLYGLAEMGLVSIILFVILFKMATDVYKIHGWKVVSTSPIIILLMMNDRFINLNPYPFVMWVLLFSLSVRPISSAFNARENLGKVKRRVMMNGSFS